MTEQEWLECEEPLRLFRSAHRSRRCRAGERVWRLVGCALARRTWADFNASCRRGVETAERFADGQATAADMEAVDTAILRDQRAMCRGFGVARWTLWGPWRGYDTLFKSVTAIADLATALHGVGERWQQCAVIRDVFGNPFRPAALDATWRTPAVAALATAAYDERSLPAATLDAARLAVLADALEEAGCTCAEVLAHLRSGAGHVRGCWALDLILGRE